jgi:L-iditol 2-dehydrogenase
MPALSSGLRDEAVEAARLHGAGDVRVGREPETVTASGEVRLTVAAIGLCGSDLHWFEEGSIGDAGLDHPLALGHEFSGRLDDGRLVAADPCIACGECRPCLAGREHLCERSRFAGHSVTDGALRSVMTWPARLLRPLPAGMTAEEGALLEPLGVALHAVDLARIQPGETAAVIGCGPIGLLVIQVLRDLGVAPIVATEPLAHRLAAALGFGAVAASAERPPVDVDAVFDTAGTDEALAAAIDACRPGGRIVLVGIPPHDRSSYRASVARRKELTLQLCRRMEAADLDRAIALAAAGRVDLAGLITHRYELEEARKAFATLAARSGIKVIVTP